MNKELINLSNLFNAGNLLLNLKKKQVFFSDKSSKKDNISPRLLNLNINELTVEYEYSIKFVGVRIKIKI